MKDGSIFPNVFIIGAPKCGTTSLADWLSQHRDFHVPIKKELNFLNTDHKMWDAWSLDDVEEEFGSQSSKFRVDASVLYCLSDTALKKISELPDVSLVVLCLRDPRSMYLSIHAQQYRTLYETESSPGKAWSNHYENVRRALRSDDADTAINLNYKEIAAPASIVKRVKSFISEDKLLIVRFEDLQQRPEKVYREILRLTGCSFQEVNFSHLNSRSRIRLRWLHVLVKKLSILKKNLGISSSFGIARFVSKAFHVPFQDKTDAELPKDAEKFFSEQSFKLRDALNGKD
ncbi:sulfotransferase domain-containing protein [Luminiphilus sp.]|nr:sulfotransferase domain-containing protein [Luminiphilus sp.]